MKEIRTQDSVGQMLCHDITQIIPGETKGPVFRKGHIIKEEDIPVLLSVGKDHVYVWENDENMLHENDAAEILREIAQGANLSASEPKEGKIELTAESDGLLKINTKKLNELNALGEMMIASRHGGFAVKAGDKIAGMRVIPLIIEKEKMERAKAAAGDGSLIEIVPFNKIKYGLITTGNEVFHGRIEDKFSPVVKEKLAEYGAELKEHIVLDDDNVKITENIDRMLDEGADMVICTGGMSVDPDDRTPLAIKNSKAEIVSYGAPVLPGAMFLLAYTADDRPVIGLPGCVMYAKRTIFDLALPKLIAGTVITKEDLSKLGEGGLCLNCEACTFPNCGFGK